MEKIRIKFVNMWEGFKPLDNAFTKIIQKKFEIELVEENPDFVICSSFINGTDKIFEYCNYSAVRIFISMENFEPNYNLFDYTLTTSYAENLDRSYRVPTFLMDIMQNDFQEITHDSIDKAIIYQKKNFCNLIFGHERDDEMRKQIADELSSYKKVDSAGTYYNNMPQGQVVSHCDKKTFQEQYKFSIAIESTDQPGFATEKIWDAYKAYTIPIYCGDPLISKIVNPKAFIDVRDYSTLKELRNKIIELDIDDDKYMQMLEEPFFNRPNYAEEKIQECEKFFEHIFDQKKQDAYRRPMGPQNGLVIFEEKIYKLINKLDKMHLLGILYKLAGKGKNR